MTHWPKWVYRGTLFLAAPSVLWTSLEMYGFSLLGPQMLFYAITHAYPGILAIVLVSVPFFILWGVLNMALAFSPRLRRTSALDHSSVLTFLAFQILHVIALLGYDYWSTIGSVRILVCAIGLALLGFSVWHVFSKIFVLKRLMKPL